MDDPDVDDLRALLAKNNGTTKITDADGNIVFEGTPEEVAAYHKGQKAARKALEVLKKAGILPPELQGMHEHEDKNFRTALQDIAKSLKITPRVVYNPGSGKHVTAATAFPESRTIFLDEDESAMHDLVGAGFEGIVGDMHNFALPDSVRADIILILNAGYMTQEELLKVISENGIVIVNNWHGAAEFMLSECPLFERVEAGIISSQNIHGVSDREGDEDSGTLCVFKLRRPLCVN